MTQLPADLSSRKIKILCFGSSTTWGYDPYSGKRFDSSARWPAVMGSILGNDFEVTEEGYSGRTVLDHIPDSNPANGKQYLDSFLENRSFDIIIIFLGINDLFADREVSVKKIAGGIEKMVLHIKLKTPTCIVVIAAPPQIHEDFEAAYLYQSEIEKSKKLAPEYKHIAAKNNTLFVDAGKIVSNCRLDGVHLDESGQKKFGRYIADFIRLSLEAAEMQQAEKQLS